MASTIHGRINKENVCHVRQTSLQLTWRYATASTSSFRAFSNKTYIKQRRWKHNLFNHFPDDRADRIQNCRKIWRYDNSSPQCSQMKSNNPECITNMQWLCKTWRLTGFKVIHAKPNQPRRRRDVFEHSYVQMKIPIYSYGQFFGIDGSLRWAELES